MELFTIKPEDAKINAYFQYLRSFSDTALETLEKFQTDFKLIKSKTHTQADLLTHLKYLVRTYEIFTLEIKDSCDFVEIPEFGTCISMTFLQLLKIIKWILREWISTLKYNLSFRVSIINEGKCHQQS